MKETHPIQNLSAGETLKFGVIICILYDAGRFCVSSFKCCLGKSRTVAEDKTRNLRKIILEGPGGIIISQYTILLHH